MVGIPEPANVSGMTQEKLVGLCVMRPCMFLHKFPGLLMITQNNNLSLYDDYSTIARARTGAPVESLIFMGSMTYLNDFCDIFSKLFRFSTFTVPARASM